MNYIFFTGATGGLGEQCVKALSKRGYIVFAVGRNKKKLSELGRNLNVIPIVADITNMKSIFDARKEVEKYSSKLYAIINFAGCSTFCSMVEDDCVDKTEKILDINVMGMIRVNRVFFDLVYAGNGRIINCSSEAGWMTPQPFAAPYFLSKYAVEAYSDSLRRELLYLGVSVIKIQPGAFRTSIIDNVNEGCKQTIARTLYYKNVLKIMMPFLMHELNKNSAPQKIIKTILKTVEVKHPKLQYRIGTGKLLASLEILPDRWLDHVYRLFFKWKVRYFSILEKRKVTKNTPA